MSPIQEANLLEKQIAITERSDSYTFRWQGRIITLYNADNILNKLLQQKTRDKTMKLGEAKRKAVELSRKTSGKIYINVDEKGICSTSKSFAADSSVYVYKNGSQISFDSKQKPREVAQENSKSNNNNLNTTEMSKAKSNSRKEEKETSSTKSSKAEKKGFTIKGLLFKGKEVVLPPGKGKKWDGFLKKKYEDTKGFVKVDNLKFNGKQVTQPAGRARKWNKWLKSQA